MRKQAKNQKTKIAPAHWEVVLEDVNEKFDILVEGNKILNQRFDGLEQRFDGLEQRFDGLEQRFDVLEQRFDGLEQRFDGLANRVDGLEVKAGGLEYEIRSGFQTIFNLLSQADVLDLRVRVEKLEKHVGLKK